MKKFVWILFLSLNIPAVATAGPFSIFKKKKKPEIVSCPALFIPESSQPVVDEVRKTIEATEMEPFSSPPTAASSMLFENALVTARNYLDERNGRSVALIDRYVWPAIKSDSTELVIPLVGAQNTGKSATFNSLPKYINLEAGVLPPREISKVGTWGGETSRPVMLIADSTLEQKRKLERRFGSPLKLWTDADTSSYEGAPLAYSIDSPLKNLIFIDTPSFDVKSERPVADQATLWADVVMFVFSTENYKSESNLEYIRQKFTEMGNRKSILVYRAGPRVSEEQAVLHIHEVAHAIYPKAQGEMPSSVLGSYAIMNQSGPPELTPIGQSPKFDKLILDLDHSAESIRKNAIEESMDVIADELAQKIRIDQQQNEELEIYRSALSALLKDNLDQVIGVFPYNELGRDLEHYWFGQTHGLRGLGRWIAHPLRQLRGTREATLHVSSQGTKEVERYLEGVVTGVVTQFLLATAQGNIRIRTTTKEFERLRSEIEDYRLQNNIQGDTHPSIQFVDKSTAIVHLADPGYLHQQLKEYRDRDWVRIKEQAKNEVLRDFYGLTAQIQGEFTEAAATRLKDRTITKKSAGVIYPLMSVVPTLAAVTFIIADKRSLLDIGSMLAIFGAHQAARFFVYLDEKNLKSDWMRVIDDWYGRRQRPRIDTILRKYLVNAINTKKPESLQLKRVEDAIETLTKPPVEIEP